MTGGTRDCRGRKQEGAVNNSFYENFPNINIGDVIRYVIESTQFGKKFKHIQPYYSKTSVEINNLIPIPHTECTERYDIYRVEETDPFTFVKIGETTSTYSTLIDV